MSKAKDIFSSFWTRIKGFLRDRNIFTFCLFLIFAAILWFGHAMNAVRERTLSVSIEYTGIPDNIAFEQPLPESFIFTVRDQGKRLQKYKEDAFVPIVVDLTQQLKHKEGEIHVSSDQVKSKIADQLQGTAKIQNIRPDVIQTNYYTQSKKTVPVVISGALSPATQYQFREKPKTTPSSITIYGKKEVLDTINQVVTEELNKQGIRDSLIQNLIIVPIEGVRFSDATVKVSVYTDQFTEKRMMIPISSRGVPEGLRLRTFPSSVEVTLHIPLAYFNEVTENDIQVVCRYPQTEKSTLPLEVRYSNKHIMQARVIPPEVEYIIEK